MPTMIDLAHSPQTEKPRRVLSPHPLQQGALASTTATATTTPQIKNLIGRVRKNKRAARASRTYEQVRAVLCKTTT